MAYKLFTSCIKGILSLYLFTLRIEIIDLRREKEDESTVYTLWHDSLLALPLLKNIISNNSTKDVHILISKSKDGDIPSLLTEKYERFHAYRVAHNARSAALRSAVNLLNSGSNIVITPDGPKGPRHKVKLGSWYAAKHSNASITPLSVTWEKSIQLKSWDKFFIPYPFSSGKIIIHESIPHKEVESIAPEELLSHLEQRMNQN